MGELEGAERNVRRSRVRGQSGPEWGCEQQRAAEVGWAAWQWGKLWERQGRSLGEVRRDVVGEGEKWRDKQQLFLLQWGEEQEMEPMFYIGLTAVFWTWNNHIYVKSWGNVPLGTKMKKAMKGMSIVTRCLNQCQCKRDLEKGLQR